MLNDPTSGLGYAFGAKLPSTHMTTIANQQPHALDIINGGAYVCANALNITESAAHTHLYSSTLGETHTGASTRTYNGTCANVCNSTCSDHYVGNLTTNCDARAIINLNRSTGTCAEITAFHNISIIDSKVGGGTLTYSGSTDLQRLTVNTKLLLSDYAVITADADAVINTTITKVNMAPTNHRNLTLTGEIAAGQIYVVRIQNSSGAAKNINIKNGVATIATAPAGLFCSVTFFYDGTNWIPLSWSQDNSGVLLVVVP